MGAMRKVLVIDGDPGSRQSFERALKDAGCSVATMADGAEALKAVSAQAYDLVVADAGAAGLSGTELAARVKAQQPWLPVVVIAAQDDMAAESRARAIGASVIHKPVSAEAIADHARRLFTTAPAFTGYAETAPAPKRSGGFGRLILSALVSLASAIALPFIALAAVAWLVAERAAADDKTAAGGTVAARIALFFAAPFVALFYMAVMPMIGMRELIRLGARTEAAAGKPPARGLGGLVRHLFAGGRAWIADAP